MSSDTLVQYLNEHGYAEALSGTGLNAALVDEDAYDELLEAFAADKAAAARLREKRAARVEEEKAQEPAAAEPVRETRADEVEAAAVKEQAEAPAPEQAEAGGDGQVADEPPAAAEPVAEEAPEPVAEAPAAPVDEEEPAPPVAEPEARAEVTAEEETAPAPEPEPEPAEAAAEVEDEPVADEEPVEVEARAEAEDEPVAEQEAPATLAEGEEAPAEAEADEESGDGQQVLSAKRYQLAGTKVLGKVDLSQIEEDSTKRKRKRKRKKAASTEDGTVQIEDRTAKPAAKPAETAAAAKKKRKKRGPSVDEEDVQQTLQETLRELEVGASRARQHRRRRRREKHAADRDREREVQEEQESLLRVTEFVSTGELANLMDVPVTEIISTLFESGMIVSINQRLDADTISYVADEFGYEVEFITEFGTDDIVIEEDAPEDLKPRAPIVTVMGHVDHGKTSLLDYIRKANVVAGEAGGITQHIGAYTVDMEDGRRITFLDTPGHEAFTAMRARGAKVTDVVILVVSADDAVMPQTVEAINHARAAEVPIIVAINKIDKRDANPQRVMQQLADQNVLVEQWGGKVQCALVSAHTGEGVEDLLEKVLLEADLRELQANPDRNAVGVVIESRLEKGRGNVSTVLIRNGTLKVGDVFVAGIHSGRVRAMFDERENRIDEVGPSQPALVLGINGAAEVGDQFVVLEDEKEARDIAQRRQQIHREQFLRQRKHITLDEIGRRLALGDFQELNLIIKGDVGGSVEALSDSLLKLSTEEVAVNIIHSGVGAINESDVMLASASDAVIIGFQVRPVPGARMLAEREEIDVRLYSVIYDAIENVRDALEGLLSPTKKEITVGTAEVRDIFKVPKAGTVAGCYVVEGKIRRNDRVRVIRDGVVVYAGSMSSLRRFKEDVREVQSGYECGISIANFNDIKTGDHIETYEIVEEKRKLEMTRA